MVEPIVEPSNKLSADELKAIPQNERGKFIESSVNSLIQANGKRGLALSEIERITQYPKNTLYKHVELLYSKRKINKLNIGKMSLFYPNGQLYRSKPPPDIMYGSKRFGVQLLENLDGQYLHLQERELDENGFSNDIGGILIPTKMIPEIINMVHYVLEHGKIELEERRK